MKGLIQMANYNFWGTPTNSFMADEPAELQYTFGYPQIPELKNLWDVYRIQAQTNSNQNQRQAADHELMQANELAKNNPATNAGIFLEIFSGLPELMRLQILFQNGFREKTKRLCQNRLLTKGQKIFWADWLRKRG